MSRYSDIRRGSQLNAALTRYTSYLTTARTPNVGSRGARERQKATGVIPFDVDVVADSVIQVQSQETGVALLAPIINANSGAQVFIDGALTGKTIVPVTGFKPARLVVNQKATRVASAKTSQITGQRYLSYDTDRFQCAFGRNSATSTGKMVPVFQALKAVLKARAGFEINRVSLTPEKISL